MMGLELKGDAIRGALKAPANKILIGNIPTTIQINNKMKIKKSKVENKIQDLELQFDETREALKAAANKEDYIDLRKMGLLISEMNDTLSQIVMLKTFV